MGRFIAFSGILVLVAVVSAGCWGRGPSRVVAPEINPGAAAAAAMEQYDTNKDGKIEGTELDAAPGLKAALSRMNPGGKSVDAAQIAARIQKWKDSRVGRTSVACTVTRKGRPLASAKVTLVPEKFLGQNLPICTGVSDESGSCSISAPTTGPNDPPGVPPGIYLVQITKDGDNIPERYNTKTTLGMEVALDAEGMEAGYRFDLNY